MGKQEQVKRAKSILNEARIHDVINSDKQLPNDEDKLVKLADQLVERAKLAHSKGERGEHVTSILYIAEVDDLNESNDEDLSEDEKLYREALSESIENLPLPPPIEDNSIPEFPSELSSLSDAKLFEIHGVYSACSARINWLHALQEAGQNAAKIIADNYEDNYIINKADRKDYGGKAKAQNLLKAEAKENDTSVKKWRDREKKHSIKVSKYRRTADIYDNYVDRCSRQYTYRMKERGN